MTKGIPIGLTLEQAFTVTAEHVIDFADNGMPAVLSTPKLIGLLERTARESIDSHLEPTESSVGVEIDIKHLAPAPMDSVVTLNCRVIHVEGGFVTFAVEAHDGFEVLCRGVHRRAVIKMAAFSRRVERKRKSSG